MRLRQFVLVARELEPVVDDLRRDLGLAVCYRDPNVEVFGLHNALLPVGDMFIEVVSPLRDGTAAGRHLERRAGDGGYMLLVQVDDLDRERARLDQLGVRIVWQGSGSGISGMHLHPADVGAAILSFDVADPPGSWGWAGPSWPRWVRSEVVRDIAAVELQSEQPAALAERWSVVLARHARPGPGRSLVIPLDGGTLRFVAAEDGRGDGIGGIDLVATDRLRAGESIQLGGVRVRLV